MKHINIAVHFQMSKSKSKVGLETILLCLKSHITTKEMVEEYGLITSCSWAPKSGFTVGITEAQEKAFLKP